MSHLEMAIEHVQQPITHWRFENNVGPCWGMHHQPENGKHWAQRERSPLNRQAGACASELLPNNLVIQAWIQCQGAQGSLL